MVEHIKIWPRNVLLSFMALSGILIMMNFASLVDLLFVINTQGYSDGFYIFISGVIVVIMSMVALAIASNPSHQVNINPSASAKFFIVLSILLSIGAINSQVISLVIINYNCAAACIDNAKLLISLSFVGMPLVTNLMISYTIAKLNIV